MVNPVQAHGTGWWLASFDEGTGLGSARARGLRLLDTPGHARPASAEDASGGAVFDGVLFNATELRSRLSAELGPGGTDAELILRAFRRWGEDALHAIKGIFALILWDASRNLLLCVRDPLGIYPLFYAERGRELLLSTSIDALLSHSQVSRSVSRTALVDYLCHRSPSAERTFFADIKRLPPGHALQVGPAGRRVFRYWHAVPPDAEPEWLDEDVVERFEELLAQAVRRYVELGPTALYLSGGLDSVTIAAVASDISRRRALPEPVALSLVFPHPDCNEEQAQRLVAAALELPQMLVPFDTAVSPRGLLLEALEMSSVWPAPLQNVWNPAYQYLARQARQRGCEVILTGGGGDEWLTVTPMYAADLLRRLDVLGLARLVRSMLRSYRRPPLALMRNLMWTNGVRLLLGEAWRWSLEWAPQIAPLRRPSEWVARRRRQRTLSIPAWVAPDPGLRREFHQRAEAEAATAVRGREPGGFYFRELRRTLNHPLVALELEEIFESGRRVGLRVLQPFWDAELVQLLCRIPPRRLNLGGRSKGLVRAALNQRFQHLNFEQQKKVISVEFFNSTMLNEGRRAWQLMGGTPALAELGVVDPLFLGDTIDRILAQHQRGEAYRIWDTLNLEAWLRPRL